VLECALDHFRGLFLAVSSRRPCVRGPAGRLCLVDVLVLDFLFLLWFLPAFDVPSLLVGAVVVLVDIVDLSVVYVFVRPVLFAGI